ncbi:hypothetical protein TNCV_1184281 [Trichonephila clavipes]|nr:hypothetical protein TNCV_1184281 [Trichonephila clavipes]
MYLIAYAPLNYVSKPSKCQFAQAYVKYLGHLVGQGLRTPGELKVQVIKDFPIPTNKTQETKFPERQINATNERRPVQGHENSLRVKKDIEDVSSKLERRLQVAIVAWNAQNSIALGELVT